MEKRGLLHERKRRKANVSSRCAACAQIIAGSAADLPEMCQWFFQFGEFRVDSTQHTHTLSLSRSPTHTHTQALTHTRKKNICQISKDRRKSQPRFGVDSSRGRESCCSQKFCPGASCVFRVGRRDPGGEVSVSTAAGRGEMLRMQQGGKPRRDDQIRTVGQGALDLWRCSSQRARTRFSLFFRCG